jgi:hypothetical protein
MIMYHVYIYIYACVCVCKYINITTYTLWLFNIAMENHHF